MALTNNCVNNADVVIRPDIRHIGFYDFHHAEELIRRGELATQSAIPEIRKRL